VSQAFSVLVDDAHIKTTVAIAREIREYGFVVDRVVPEAGAIRAIGDASRAATIRSIVGVLEVKPEAMVTLPPMSDKIPQ
jgi:hypothetical protein